MYSNNYFKFTKYQQKGVLLLLFLIIICQCIFLFIEMPNDRLNINPTALDRFYREVDSLKRIELAKSKPKIYPFNPNFITDYKGYTLGMSLEEINRLHNFRKQNKWVNSTREFQKVTQVSDSLLEVMSSNFKFPDWVNTTQPKRNATTNFNYNKPLTFSEKKDLNKATQQQLQEVHGIGVKLSERILRFRNKYVGGFVADIQLQDVYGLSTEVIDRITQRFTVKTPRQVVKHDLNTVTVEDLVTVQHIDYDLAYEILEQRTLRDGFSSFEELIKVKGFPVDKIEIIRLYLTLK